MKITKKRVMQIIKEEIGQKELGDSLLDIGKKVKTNSQISSEAPMLSELITLLIDKSSSGTADSKMAEILEFAKSKLGAK